MAGNKKPSLVLFGDLDRRFVSEAIERFRKFAEGKVEILCTCFEGEGELPAKKLTDCDYAVVFGGDGTILSAARQLSEANVPVIGVNAGKLGFLAEFSIDELEELFDDIFFADPTIENRMIIRCCVMREGRECFYSTAINDVVITAGEPFRMIELQVTFGGQQLAGFVGDGVIISTPTGSTAYNISAGGPILSANLSALVVTPICPHSLSFRPIVINADSAIEIFGLRMNEGSTVTLDGQLCEKVKPGDIVRVEKDDGAFLVVNNPMRTQWDTLAGKLSWAQKPNYSKREND